MNFRNGADARLNLLLALALFAVMVAVGIYTRPLLPIDETRYLTVAWEMHQNGNWLVPFKNGEAYSHKPPLLFWSINAAWALFGVSEALARAIPPLYAFATMILLVPLARLLWPEERAVAANAPLVLTGMAIYTVFASLAMFDAMLAFFVVLGLYAVALLWRRGLARYWLLFALALGLAVLAKGPVALLHMLPVPLFAPLWMDRPGNGWGRWYLGLLGGVLGGAAIALAWALPAAAAGGEAYANAILWGQTAGRAVKAFAHARPWWFYIVLLPAILLPLPLMPSLWRRLRPSLGGSGGRFCLIWLLVPFIALSLVSGKQIHYLIPLFPGLALVIGRLLGDRRKTGRGDALALAGLPLISGVLLFIVPWSLPLVRGLVKKGIPAWVADIEPWAGAVSLLAGAVLYLGMRSGRLRPASGFALGGAVFFVILHFQAAAVALDRFNLQPVAQLLKTYEDKGLAVADNYHGQFNFLGRLTRPVQFVAPSDVGAWFRAHPGGRLVSTKRRERFGDVPLVVEMARPYRSREIYVYRLATQE